MDAAARQLGASTVAHTDKTSPYLVRLWTGALEREAVHNHADGVCDLPQTYADELAQYTANGGFLDTDACHWDLSYTGVRICCCRLCRDSAGLRELRRRDRRRARHELGEVRKIVRADPGVVDEL